MPLPFIASFDCAALPRIGGFDLPAEGSLLFFLDHECATEGDSIAEEQSFARVVYVPAGTDTVLPDGPPEETLNYENPFLRPEEDLFATFRPVVPPWLTYDDDAKPFVPLAIQEWISPLTHTDELVAVVEELWPLPDSSADFCVGGYPGALGIDGTPDFCIGGYPMELGIGDTPESLIALADVMARQESGELDLSPAERDLLTQTETPRIIRDWLPLAQFATSDDFYYGRFMIRRDDLAARRFDRALSFTMFTE
jgi:hypothetical protein